MKKPLLWLIYDGFGENKDYPGNAIKRAKMPNMDRIKKEYPNVLIGAAGLDVGLPEGQMGNSEVGHMNMGAGRTLFQGLTRINIDVEKQLMRKNTELLKAFNFVKKTGGKLHIMGLASYGGVHSQLNHIYGLIDAAKFNGINNINFHAFGDGRDVPPTNFEKDLVEIKKNLAVNGAKLVSIVGRYYAMDRDTNFERTQVAYDLLTKGKGIVFDSPEQFVKDQYKEGINDEFFKAGIDKRYVKDSLIEEKDAIIFANFRPDRARQLSHMFIKTNIYQTNPDRLKNIFFMSMMQYDQVDCPVAYPLIKVENTFGQTISKAGLTQLRIAETEKYAHVTFFFNGGEDVTYKNETRVLVDSPKVATYDLKPEMSAVELTDALIANASKYDVIVMNYANPDMVGHTGVLKAAIEAMEVIDVQFGRVYDHIVKKLGGVMFITADHGNAEIMLTDDGKPVTSHSSSKVPLIITDKSVVFNSRDGGKLGDVAPTILKYLGIKIPPHMDGKILIK